MLRVAVLVSGGGTNLQAIIDAVENGTITNTELVGVISNNKNAYALKRAGNHQIPAQCVSPKDFETREEFNKVFLEKVDELKPDLIVLAGFLVVIPDRSCRVPGSDSAGDDPEVQKSDHQYPSISDSVVLRNGILWTEGS